ncbi:Raffinose synthase or seed imbibition protein Sip1 [Flavobacterium flevense]|uniref:Glycoside hydrolase family 36 n=1 Tax=Flavobacterium flevense TaxID=983 RepID=A0A4Y4AWV4_9FLAO|nr:Sip1-related alpha-galactosidase [Flavobacterium flevense]GEC72596.1 glycoside hydrolase family 36 [Flavobacterium flevense]SHM15320.1 Raffinose synthase or seed imbibition protein Sip1 [Flavobacterium flevense]
MQKPIKNLFLFLSIAFSVISNSQTNKIKNNVFDASAISKNGIEILNGYSAVPNNGVLGNYSVTLPEYESVVYISTIGREKILDGMNRVFSWAAKDLKTIVTKDFNPDTKAGGEPSRNGLLALFKLKNDEFLLLQGVTSPKAMSYFVIADDGKLSINLATFGIDAVSGDIPLITYARGKNVYDVFQKAWKNAIYTEALKGRTAMRYEKEYPEIFKYLGWCSWEQYHTKVSSDLMVDAMQKIEKSPLPIRWVLLDNGHEHSYKSADGMNSSRMLSLKGSPETFPNGFKPMMDAKTEKIKWTGIWHTMNAHWQGLHPEHEIHELDPYLVKISKSGGFDVMMPKGDYESSQKFYNTLIGSAKKDGFDFVKIDNQNRQIAFYQGMSNPVAIVSQHAQSLESAALEHSDGLMNCFCLDMLSLMNTKYSATSRVSVDYLLNNEAKAKSHLLQSYQNTLWMGQAVWPDHDMFHSSDKFCGQMMAVSKAMSGAPIYLSDAPVDFQEKLVLPLSYSDGELLRPLAPAVPLPESVMLSALTTPQAYRVVAPLQHGAAAFVAYNLMHPAPADKVTSAFRVKDYEAAGEFIQPKAESWKAPKEGLVFYDWYEQKGGKLENEYKFDLIGFADKLVQLSPIKNGWSVIGNPNKYLSASTVKSIEYSDKKLKIVMIESGELVVYNPSPISCSSAKKIENMGNGLWKLYLPEAQKNFEVVITLKD